MTLSLKELRRTATVAQTLLAGARLKRVDQPDAYSLVFTCVTETGKIPLLLSCHPQYARIGVIESCAPVAADGSFCQYLRAHWMGSRLDSITCDSADRQVSLKLWSAAGAGQIIFSLLRAYSNIYLLDADNNLLHTLRPLEETRQELTIGSSWLAPRPLELDEGVDRWAALPDAELLAAIARAGAALEQQAEAEALVRVLRQALKKEHTFLDRKRGNLMEDLGKARQAGQNRRYGELLKNVLHTVKPGDRQVQAVDYETGRTEIIPLDETLSPVSNLERYFARYQKEQRGETRILEQLEELEATRLELERLEQRLQKALSADHADAGATSGNMAELKALTEEPRLRRSLKNMPVIRKSQTRGSSITGVTAGKTAGKSAAGKSELPSKLRPKRYRTEEGLEIWVGRSDEGNDYLTTRLARGNDLFFHLDGYPGSHVILRTEGRTDPSSKSILDACELAVHFSKMKNAGSVDIHMAPVKDVKKPKGAKAGLVYVRAGKSIRLKRDAGRLERILATRLDE